MAAAETSLIPQNPNLHPPNFFLCDAAYGIDLLTNDCLSAVNFLPGGSSLVGYVWNNGNNRTPWSTPMSRRVGRCIVTIDIAGAVMGPSLYAVPDDLKGLAFLLVAQCVAGLDVGGFATKNFQNLYNFAANPYIISHGIVPVPPPITNFFTVTVTSIIRPYPGVYDPAIPLAIADGLAKEREDVYPSNVMQYDLGISYWRARAEHMERGGSVTWYQPIADVSDDMTYECDASLGSPATADCAQIEWNQLGSSSSSDTVTVSPGATTFLHQNTCYLAISATVSLTLTWEQIRTAVTTLMNVCVQNPFQPVQGGRAYFQHQAPLPVAAAGSSRQRRKGRDNTSGMTGWNALPLGVNITMFEQQESWTDSTAELKSCTWSAVLKGVAVSTCHV